MMEVKERITLTVEPGSRVVVSPEQAAAAGKCLVVVTDGAPESGVMPPAAARRFDFSPETYRAMIGRLSVAELSAAAAEAGVPVSEAMKKADFIEALAARLM